tara:strand:- start:65 stop:262 length:198 start_codon:yes stop_codon:yes gene_type:complete
MTFSQITTKTKLKNTNTNTFVTVISVNDYGFTAKETGNGRTVFKVQNIGKYSKYSVNSGSWELVN